jgi:glycosyltransferase involved in cell wall biosynthesis
MSDRPAVSVVIPTYRRPHLVPHAVRSALAQTAGDLEVIVVIDGRDDETRDALGAIADPRLSLLVPDRHLGNADARNAGVARAHGSWIAFLDDDDTWLPPKLERQLEASRTATTPRPIVSCHLLARHETGEMVWPRRLPRAGEDWSEYFFCRTTPFTGEGMVIHSAMMAPRDLCAEVPFSSGLDRHVDPDWLLRALRLPGTSLTFPRDTDPLVIWNIERSRPRITMQRDWEGSLRWCRARRDLFSDRGYAAFLLHVVGSNAAAQHAWRAFGSLLLEAFRDGRPAVVDVASHVANFTIPASVQQRVATWYARRRT